MKRLILITAFIGVILLMPGCFDFSNTSENNNYPDTEEQVKENFPELTDAQAKELADQIKKYFEE